MPKTIFIDIPGINAHTARRQVVATLTHYGFEVTQASAKQSRNVACVRVMARHCANDHESAARLAACALPTGTRVGIDHRNPFH